MNVSKVIARLRAEGNVAKAWFDTYERPRPLTAEQIAAVRAPDGSTPPSEISEWLAYDATWIPLLEKNDATRLAATPLRAILEARAGTTRRPKSMKAEALAAIWINMLPEPELADALVVELPMSGSQEHFLVLRKGKTARVLGFHNQSEFWWKYKSFGAYLSHYFGYEDPD